MAVGGDSMANLMDYLDWRGDLTLEQSEFNEIDNLILAQLAYVDFEGIVPGPDEKRKISVSDASRIFFETHDVDEIMKKVSMTKTAMFVLQKMADTERFKDAMLHGYVNDISLEEQSQFSVVCVSLSDKSIYVAFSGTDDTIVGWRENFNMGFLSETPGQLKAVDYLNQMIGIRQRVVRVGGHSKGGNLSVYAAVKCNPSIKRKIIEVYSNDGPGFSREMVDSDEYQEMLPRIKTILPESSIVGMLLEHEESYEVVKSSNSGIGQHDAMSWEVMGAKFLYGDAIAPQSIFWDETMKSWLRHLTRGQREELVNAVFSLLEEVNIQTVDDFANIKWKTISELLKAKKEMEPEIQQLFSKALKLLWKSGNEQVKNNMKHRVKGNNGFQDLEFRRHCPK